MIGLRKTHLRSLAGALAISLAAEATLAYDHTPANSTALTNVLTGATTPALQLGDTITLTAGTTYTGTFTLPNLSTGTGWVTIRSSQLASLPAAGRRVGPSNAANMPKIVPANSASSAIKTAASAHHFKLSGLEVITYNAASAMSNDLIALGDGAYTLETQEPRYITIDRCIVRTHSSTTQIKRGIALNSRYTDILDSYIAGFKVAGQEAQAIGGWNGHGPFNIINNYIEGAGENVMFGGTDPAINGLIPTDIVFTKNYLTKPLSWNPNHASYVAPTYSVKNIFELKNARNVLIEGNIFEHNWVQSQDGTGILFTVRNQGGFAPWCIVENVTFRKNIVRKTAHAFNTLGYDNTHPSGSGISNHINIENNLIYDIGGLPWTTSTGGTLYKLLSTSDSMTFNHNTAFHLGSVGVIESAPDAITNFRSTNNISPHNNYGFIGTGQGTGNGPLNYFFVNAVFDKNVLFDNKADASQAQLNSMYSSYDDSWSPVGLMFPQAWSDILVDQANPGTNFAGWKVKTTSAYHNAGTDGKSPGCDIDAVVAATAGCVSGVWPNTQVTKVLKNGVNGYTGATSFHVSGQSATTHYGPSVYHHVLGNSPGSSGYTWRPFYKFDLTQGANAIPANATIDSASLRIPVTMSGSSTDRTVRVHRVAPVGGAFTVNYATATKNHYNGTNTWTGGTNAGGDVADSNNDFLDTPDSTATLPTAGTTGNLTFNVTSSVQAWVNGSSNQGWLLITGSTSALSVYLGATADITGPVDYPELTITYH